MIDLRLEPKFFWSLTPAQLYALVERTNQLDKRTDSRFGMIVCTILNLFIKSGSKAVGPLQAMGYDKSEDARGAEEERPQTPEEAALRFRIMAAGFNRLAAATKKVE